MKIYVKTNKWNYNFRIIAFFLSVENNPGVFGLFIPFYYNISIYSFNWEKNSFKL